jgi:hypothetical protein
MSQAIADAAIVKQFLANEVIDAALKRVAATIYQEFRDADSSEERVTAWARAKALEDVLNELHAVKSAGEREATESEKRARKPKEI